MQQAWGPWVGTDDARTRLDVGAESHDGFVRIWAQGIVENVYIQTSRVYMHVNINGNDKYGGEQRITGEGQNFTLVTHSLDIPRTHSTQYVKVYATCNYALTGEDSYAETWVAIDPKRSWQVSFDANGGSGAPPQMTKWLGEDMYLPQARPTRDLYDFRGWATSRGGGVAYQPGQQYLPDQDVTLFAVWKLAWAQPTISGVTATRCDSGGADDEDGTCAKVTARWAVRQSGQSGGTVTVHRRPSAGGDWVQAARQSVSGASGTFSKVVSGFPAGTSWDVRVTFSDGTAEAQALALVPQSFVPLEFSPGGGAVSLGSHVPAGAKSGLFVRGYPVPVVRGGTLAYDGGDGTPRSLLYQSSSAGEGGTGGHVDICAFGPVVHVTVWGCKGGGGARTTVATLPARYADHNGAYVWGLTGKVGVEGTRVWIESTEATYASVCLVCRLGE